MRGPHCAFLFVCAVVAPAVGYGVSPAVSVATRVGRVATLNLTRSDRYDNIAVVGNRIVLYGPAGPSFTQPSTSSTCSSAIVNPSTLALRDVRSGSCADPTVFDRSVIPAISIDKNLPSPSGGPTAVVRIAHVTSRSPGYSLGPIVMTFPAWAYSQTQPYWIYGDGDLWLYDWVNRFDLLRISATTGAVLQRLSVPKIQMPLLALNDNGLWIAPYGESSGSLYRLTPGATKLSAVFHLGSGGFAWWLLASGHFVWLEAQPRPVSETATIWELRGPNAVPVWHEAPSAALKIVPEQRPTPPVSSWMVGDEADGLWTVLVSRSGSQQEIIRLDPRTGRSAVVATLNPGYAPGAQGELVPAIQSWVGVTLDGSLFLLDPPAIVAGTSDQVSGFSALYRITPSGAR